MAKVRCSHCQLDFDESVMIEEKSVLMLVSQYLLLQLQVLAMVLVMLFHFFGLKKYIQNGLLILLKLLLKLLQTMDQQLVVLTMQKLQQEQGNL